MLPAVPDQLSARFGAKGLFFFFFVFNEFIFAEFILVNYLENLYFFRNYPLGVELVNLFFLNRGYLKILKDKSNFLGD